MEERTAIAKKQNRCRYMCRSKAGRMPGAGLGFVAFFQLYQAFAVFAASIRIFWLVLHAAARRHEDALLHHLAPAYMGVDGHPCREGRMHRD